MGMPGIIIAVVITIDAKTMPEKAVRLGMGVLLLTRQEDCVRAKDGCSVHNINEFFIIFFKNRAATIRG